MLKFPCTLKAGFCTQQIVRRGARDLRRAAALFSETYFSNTAISKSDLRIILPSTSWPYELLSVQLIEKTPL